MKRKARNDCLGGAAGYNTPVLYGQLYRMIIKHDVPTPRKQPRKPPSGKKKIPDDVILEIRRLHEGQAISRKELCQRFAEHDISDDYMRRILDYTTRSRLVP